jgi:dienelactone hydrolase
MIRRLALLLAFVFVTASAPAQPLTFDHDKISGPWSNGQGELYLPAGKGPFPAVVVLHGCNGVSPHYRLWAQRLMSWGYMTLLVDSFRPRGFTNVCNQGMLVPAELRARDAFAAAEYLRSLANVRADRVGVIGFSHGGWTVMQIVQTKADFKPFAAAVAFYPWCASPEAPLTTDTLVLIGDADDWTPAERCESFRALARTDGHVLRMKIYPGALHAFDNKLARKQLFAGHWIGGQPEGADGAIAETRAFLAERLLR